MLDFLKFYTSDFGTWLGVTVGVALAVQGIVSLLSAIPRPKITYTRRCTCNRDTLPEGEPPAKK